MSVLSAFELKNIYLIYKSASVKLNGHFNLHKHFIIQHG